MPGSAFGVYQARDLTGMVRAGRTTFNGATTPTGVHLDDIVIGLAERGETFSGPSLGPGSWADNPFSSPSFDGRIPEITDGPYQVEIRTSRELLMESTNHKWTSAFVGINERLTRDSTSRSLTTVRGFQMVTRLLCPMAAAY